MNEELKAPFPYFGGKVKAAPMVWDAFGDVKNYVEPFCGSAAMLLQAPDGNRVETVNDADGFIANFWRSIQSDPEGVAHWADWPVNEIDLTARHGWLVNRADRLKWSLEDPDFYDVKIAGWWVWGACNWIGSGWCEGKGAWVSNGATVADSRQLPHLSAGRGINRQLPHLSAGRGINRKLPHLSAGRGINRQLPHLGDAGQGINRKLPHLSAGRGINRKLPHLSAGRGINRQLPHLGDAGRGINRHQFIFEWFAALSDRLRDVRVACGDWQRVVKDSVTTRHGLTAVFLDPPYSKGAMDYAAGGVGTDLPMQVQEWCAENGANPLLRIAICGHGGEHSALESLGWIPRAWKAGGGYAQSAEAVANRKSETIWFSPACVSGEAPGALFFDKAA